MRGRGRSVFVREKIKVKWGPDSVGEIIESSYESDFVALNASRLVCAGAPTARSATRTN